jgi:hypothetical protein
MSYRDHPKVGVEQREGPPMTPQASEGTDPREEEGPARASSARLRRRALAVGVGTAVALGSALATTGTAAANPFGNEYVDPNGVVMTYADNSNHTYVNESLIAQHEIAMDYAMLTRLEATDMTVQKQLSGNTDTDVKARDDDYPNSGKWIGRWTCVDAFYNGAGERLCNQAIVEINQHHWSPDDDGVRSSKVTTHETGHSVGLIHTSTTDSCMYPWAESATTSDFNTHDKVHINGRY